MLIAVHVETADKVLFMHEDFTGEGAGDPLPLPRRKEAAGVAVKVACGRNGETFSNWQCIHGKSNRQQQRPCCRVSPP